MKKRDPVIEMIKLAFRSLSYEKRFDTIRDLLDVHDALTITESIATNSMPASGNSPYQPLK